ncbi:MAG: quinolinate synthase NadA [Bacteroidales bacterium]|jgi:quinolinate synthase|nr:quinolinate synthase NadA [Bacteroidales bacterium]
MKNNNIINEIELLKKEKNAIILAHYYVVPEVQEVADFVGDSLALAHFAQNVEADIIVFAGVNFMAETAKILNHDKKVLVPDLESHCSLADSYPAEDFEKFLKKHPDHKVISYINCSADIKALSTVICTSSNAVDVVESFPKEQKLIFAPDKNLGSYINSKTGREMVLWDGACHVHDRLNSDRLLELVQEHPDAKVIAHPECKDVILNFAEFIGSTKAMLEYTQKDESQKYIVATETGIIYQMQKASPNKEFIVLPSDENCNCNDCPYMKLNSLEKIVDCLKNETNELNLDYELMEKAKLPLLRMFDISFKTK